MSALLLVRTTGSGLTARRLHRFQHAHGYTWFRLDDNDGRRFITAAGWDAYSPAGTLLPLNRSAASARSLERLHYEEELFGVRGIRHCFRARRNLSLAAWQALARPILSAGSHDKHANHRPLLWLATRQPTLEEPSFESQFAGLSPERRAAAQGGWLHRSR